MKGSSSRGFWGRAFRVALALTVGVILGLGLWVGQEIKAVSPLLEQMMRRPYRPAEKTKLYASDGTLLLEVFEENREFLPLERLPEHVWRAVVAIEDHRFFSHPGVDARAILRALRRNWQTRRPVEGGSTLTQQWVRRAFLSQEKTWRRKLREILLALVVRLDRYRTWRPSNFDGHFHGRVPLEQALVHSLNAATLHLAFQVGLEAVAEMAQRLGIRTPLRVDPALALGASEVRLLEITAAYLPFANGGLRLEPTTLRRVSERSGGILLQHRPQPQPVLSPEVASTMNAWLQKVVEEGTGRGARCGLRFYPGEGPTVLCPHHRGSETTP